MNTENDNIKEQDTLLYNILDVFKKLKENWINTKPHKGMVPSNCTQ